MAAAFPIRWQFDRHLDTTGKRLAVALAVSLLLHGMIYTGWKVAPAVTAYVKQVAARVLPKNFLTPPQQEVKQPEPKPRREVPLVFVEVDPARATAEAPKDTKNYSTHNSFAANEQPKNLDVPKIDGAQKHVMRVEDVAKPKPQPLQPTPPPEPKPVENTEPEAKPKAAPAIGDLAMTKNVPKTLKPAEGDAEKAVEKPRDKPRTVAEARLRNPDLAGQKMQQEGGVPRHAHVALDAKGSPFGNYDSVFISMVQQRWYALLENNQYMLDRRGQVALTFALHYDGRITALEKTENTVGEVLGLLCEKAILDPAPFPKWPTPMRQAVEKDVREIRFTFFYE